MGRKTAGRQTYLNELVGEIATGKVGDLASSKTMAWGNDHEQDAQNAYAAKESTMLEKMEVTAEIFDEKTNSYSPFNKLIEA
jgi:hypothetical protein